MLFTVDVDGNFFIVSWGEKSPKTEQMFYRMGGVFRDFNKYRFPLDGGFSGVLRKIKDVEGKVRVTTAAKDAAKAIREDRRRIEELSHADSDADLPDVLVADAPVLAGALRNYQRACVKFTESISGLLLADEPGAGKTAMTIASLIGAGVEGDILVLSPSIATQVTWPEEISKWAPSDEILRVVGTRKQREAVLSQLQRKSAKKRRWVLCNIEMAKVLYKGDGRYDYQYPELFFLDYGSRKSNPRLWASIVCDESHRVLVTNKAQAYKQTQNRCGLGKLSVVEGGKRIAISGTPFRGKLQNLWGTLNWLYPDQYRSYWKWVDRWFDTETGYFDEVKIQGVPEEKKPLFYQSIAPFMLRRTKAEIAPDLPPKQYAGTNIGGLVGHWVEMSPKQKKAYQQMKEEAVALLDSGSLVANGVLAEMTRLKQFATSYGKLSMVVDDEGFENPVFTPELPSNKLDWLLSFIDELGIEPGKATPSEGNRKLVVASQFTSVIDTFADYLIAKKYRVLRITGKVTQKEREKAVQEFQTDGGAQILMLNTKAGGVALTLDRADDLVILDETFIPDDQEQVEDRIHRVSRVHNVTIHYVRSLGTIEEKIARLTSDRNDLEKEILDGERGVKFARKLIAG